VADGCGILEGAEMKADLVGTTFGNLTVVSFSHSVKRGIHSSKVYWKCLCPLLARELRGFMGGDERGAVIVSDLKELLVDVCG
jgi:hypothetical protein